MSGNTLCLKQFVNIILRGVSNEASLIFIILIEIPSQPCALLGLRDLMMFRIFSSEILKSFIKEVGVGIC